MTGSEAASAQRDVSIPDEVPGPRVLIVEDHELMAQSVGLALTGEGYEVRLSELDGMDEVLVEAAEHKPDVVLLDLDLGGRLGDGVGLIAPLRGLGAHVLVVTGTAVRARHGMCVEQGAIGVLSKSTRLDDLVAAIQQAAAGRTWINDHDRHELLAALRAWRAEQTQRLAPFERLTPRERQVLACLLEGLSAERIAQAWFVSEATVRSQIRGVLTKLDVGSQLAAVAAARRAGWEPAPE
jgi:DNA-binding NarL/FixJ family response regulator